jgi:hypothetical protein
MSLDVWLEISATPFEANITHNLNRMAEAAGVYKVLWRPEENEIKCARDLIKPLSEGLRLLHSDPERFKKLNPDNGWGDYEGLVSFVQSYLYACVLYPDAEPKVSR